MILLAFCVAPFRATRRSESIIVCFLHMSGISTSTRIIEVMGQNWVAHCYRFNDESVGDYRITLNFSH